MGAYRHIERGLLLLDQLGMGREVTSQAGLLISLAERNGEQQLEAQWRTFVAGLARHDVLLMASARNSEGLQARDAGQLDQARAAHLEALVSYQEAGVSGGVAFTETCLAFLALDRGDTAGAVRHLRAALPAAMSSSDDATLALALDGVAIAVCDGDPESSAALLGAASSFWSSSAAHARASHQDAVAVVAHRLREVLGTARFVTAYDRGAGCGRHEALTIAGSALRAGTSAQLSETGHGGSVPSEQTAWNPPPLSTDSRAALARYRLGVAALVAGIAHADGLLAEAVAADPSFLLARVGLAVARVTSGHPYVSPRPVTALQRGERQHLEIVDAALTGARSRADDLRKEHLLEYPGDLLIVWLPRSDLGPADSARLAAPRSSPPVQVRPRCEGRERYPGSAQPLRPGGRRRPAVASLRSRR